MKFFIKNFLQKQWSWIWKPPKVLEDKAKSNKCFLPRPLPACPDPGEERWETTCGRQETERVQGRTVSSMAVVGRAWGCRCVLIQHSQLAMLSPAFFWVFILIWNQALTQVIPTMRNFKVFSTLIGRDPTSLDSLLVESFRMLLPPAILCHKEPACRIQIQSPLLGALERKLLLLGLLCLFFAGSLWHKDSWLS